MPPQQRLASVVVNEKGEQPDSYSPILDVTVELF
jgi:hypothetical protein